jgi:transposase
VRHLLAAYDVESKQLWGQVKRRKRAREFLAFLKSIRRRYTGRIWIVLDNLSAHTTPHILRYIRTHNIRFQRTPTDASWLNRIECHFTHLKKNVLTHCDYETFDAMRIAIHKYLRWRNKNQQQLLFLKRH